MNQRYIPDGECKQGRCARPTSGCLDRCGLEEALRPTISGPLIEFVTKASYDELLAENARLRAALARQTKEEK